MPNLIMTATISAFIKYHYPHFNAAALIVAAEGYKRHLDSGAKMMITLAGAKSTAELGVSLAEMIRPTPRDAQYAKGLRSKKIRSHLWTCKTCRK